MPTCSELCPIARSLKDRTYQKGKHPGGKTTYVLITTIVDGVSVTALEDHWHPGIVRTQVPENANPSCNLKERINKSYEHGGPSANNERCVYVPGETAWITVLKILGRHNNPSDITNSALLAKYTHLPVPQSEMETAVVFGSLGMAHVAPDAQVLRQK
jgi:hypothetical protein